MSETSLRIPNIYRSPLNDTLALSLNNPDFADQYPGWSLNEPQRIRYSVLLQREINAIKVLGDGASVQAIEALRSVKFNYGSEPLPVHSLRAQLYRPPGGGLRRYVALLPFTPSQQILDERAVVEGVLKAIDPDVIKIQRYQIMLGYVAIEREQKESFEADLSKLIPVDILLGELISI